METFVESDARDPFGRLLIESDHPIERMRDAFRRGALFAEAGDALFRLKGGVGEGERNDRIDTAKVETLLERAGLIDLKRSGGPTGFMDEVKTDAIREAQENAGLRADGRIRPGGETMRMLKSTLAPQPTRNPLGAAGNQKSIIRPPIDHMATRASDGEREGQDTSPASPADVGSGGIPTAQAGTARRGASSGPQRPPIIPIPSYRKDVFARSANANAWQGWSQAVRTLPNLSSAEERAYMETFAAEGGRLRDPRGTASSGITQGTLNDLIKRGKLPSIPPNTPPDQLSLKDRARFYRKYLDDALSNASGGHQALARIGDDEAVAAFADTLFRHGKNGGASLIQEAINAAAKQANAAAKQTKVKVDGYAGDKTIDEFRRLVTAGPKSRRRLLDALAAKRKAVASGEGARFEHFRFSGPP